MYTINNKQADVLKDLLQLDIDAVEAYQQALKQIDDEDVHAAISNFRDDHEEHIRVLTEILMEQRFQPPERAKDFQGFLISGFTAIRSLTGTIGALKAMKTNEELTNKKYSEAYDIDFPENIKQVIRKNYNDEKKHLEYINNILAQK